MCPDYLSHLADAADSREIDHRSLGWREICRDQLPRTGRAVHSAHADAGAGSFTANPVRHGQTPHIVKDCGDRGGVQSYPQRDPDPALWHHRRRPGHGYPAHGYRPRLLSPPPLPPARNAVDQIPEGGVPPASGALYATCSAALLAEAPLCRAQLPAARLAAADRLRGLRRRIAADASHGQSVEDRRTRSCFCDGQPCERLCRSGWSVIQINWDTIPSFASRFPCLPALCGTRKDPSHDSDKESPPWDERP